MKKVLDNQVYEHYITQKEYTRLRLNAFIKVMKALSDPNRIKIVKLLQQRVLCVCELQAALEISQPNVSKHLKILEDAGIVQSSKEGLWVNYSLTSNKVNPYAASMLGNLWYWLDEDPDIVGVVEKVHSLNRHAICPRE